MESVLIPDAPTAFCEDDTCVIRGSLFRISTSGISHTSTEADEYAPLLSRSETRSLKLKRYPGPYASDSIPALFARQVPSSGVVRLDFSCAVSLNWPLDTLTHTKSEDIVLINFHLWVLGISIVALLKESFVHMRVAFLLLLSLQC